MKALTLNEFIYKSKVIHGDKYEYPSQEFKNTKTKIKILCKNCNSYFYQIPSSHLLGKGCKKCSSRKPKELFIKQCFEKHGNNFIYDLKNYENSYSKINIKCLKCCFEFTTTCVSHLLSKNGCPKCSRIIANNLITKSFESFKNKSIYLNGDIFNFKILENPFNRKSNIEVTCKLCDNIFISYANNILNKHGCPSCSHNSKNPNTEGFIYELIYNNIPIKYVGITTCSLKTRLRRHKEAIKYGKSSSKLYNLLKDKNLELLDINKLETCKASELAEKEDYWINKLNTKYPYGLNKNKGGSGLNLKYIIK